MAAAAVRRNKQRNDGSNNEDASKLIRENMKCPVCLEVLLPPIYQCETGHNICYLCVDEVTECPLCKSDYGDTRNYFAEELVNSMTFPCKYEEYGCHKTYDFLGSQLKDHQENCECQPYRCPELACQEVVGIHQMTKHLDKHGFKVMKGDVHQASVEILDDHFDRKTEYNPWRISALGVEFYTVSTRSRDGLWYFWAYGLGLQKDMKKFSYEILLHSDEKQIMYRGAVQSLRTSPEDIMKSGSCLITMDNVIKSIRKNGRIKCQIYFIQGKNWDSRCGMNNYNKCKPKHAAKNVKKNIMKGKNKTLVSNSSTCAGSNATIGSSQTSTTPSIPTPICSRSRVLHNNVKASAIDIIKRDHAHTGGTTVSGSNVASASKKGSKPKVKKSSKGSVSRTAITVSEEEDLFVQKIRETLRCPGCNEVITPPVFQCLIGHSICHKCKGSRQDCALCRAPLGECRNFFAEELLYKTFQRCPYTKHGCKVCLPTAQMRSHEMICEFAPFECPFNVCRTMLSAEDLFDHLQTHQISVVNKELKGEIVVPKNAPSAPVCTIPNILTVDKVPFYPIVVRDTDGSWLFYILAQNHTMYRYELLLKKQSKTIAFLGPVLSLRTTYSQVKQKGSALIAAEKTIKSFKSYEKIAYHIKIIKLGGPTGKDSAFSSTTSWVLMPKGTEVVSKTELYANKKTSVSVDEESDEEDTTSLQRNATTIYVSETEDFDTESDFTSDAEISTTTAPTTRGTDDGVDCDCDSDDSREKQKINSANNQKSESQRVGPVASGPTKKKTSRSLTQKSRPIPADINSNNIAGVAAAPGSSGKAAATRSNIHVELCKRTDSDLGNNCPAEPAGASLLRATRSSIHNLKLAKEAASNLDDHTQEARRERSRSIMKNRVRLSEDIICCEHTAGSTTAKPRKSSKSQVALHGNSSPAMGAAVTTAASKHVLSIQVWDDDQNKNSESTESSSSKDKDPCSIHTEFGELKQAVEAHPNGDHPEFEDVGDLLAVKSINGVTDAISAVNDAVSGGFDVAVKSVISLFTSEKSETNDSNENLG